MNSKTVMYCRCTPEVMLLILLICLFTVLSKLRNHRICFFIFIEYSSFSFYITIDPSYLYSLYRAEINNSLDIKIFYFLHTTILNIRLRIAYILWSKYLPCIWRVVWFTACISRCKLVSTCSISLSLPCMTIMVLSVLFSEVLTCPSLVSVFRTDFSRFSNFVVTLEISSRCEIELDSSDEFIFRTSLCISFSPSLIMLLFLPRRESVSRIDLSKISKCPVTLDISSFILVSCEIELDSRDEFMCCTSRRTSVSSSLINFRISCIWVSSPMRRMLSWFTICRKSVISWRSRICMGRIVALYCRCLQRSTSWKQADRWLKSMLYTL